MAGEARIGLDNPALRGRLRPPVRRQTVYQPRQPGKVDSLSGWPQADGYDSMTRLSQPDQAPVTQEVKSPAPLSTTEAAPVDQQLTPPEPVWQLPVQSPAVPEYNQANTKSAWRNFKNRCFGLPVGLWSLLRNPRATFGELKSFRPRLPESRLQLALMVMAILVFALGLVVNLQTINANHSTGAQVAALSKQADVSAGTATNSMTASSTAPPSTTKPTVKAVESYAVEPNYPRYLIIPKLGVDARVFQVGVTSSGALGTPSNVFDTAWYTGSAEPGQPGAVLIDGHVSSWTSKGVFYGIHTLVAGDKIQIERGDGTMFNYQVVKTTVYPSGNVDMQSAITPITPGKPGLNLITCTGQVIKGTSLFNERVIVYAEQI